jgi:hypothetical protein
MSLQFDGNTSGYFKFRAELETKVILETSWLSFWQNCTFLDEPLENLGLFTDSDLLTLNQVLVESLKDFVDAHQENNEICRKLRTMHETTFANLRTRFPELRDGDGFQEYLESREESEHREDYRVSGKRCIHCGSESVRSNGNHWQCDSCKRGFRKKEVSE